MEKTIYKKLMAVQSELKAPKGQYNKFGGYNYRSCEDILEAVKPLLSSHGLVLTIADEIKTVGDRFYVQAEARLIDADNGDEIKTSAYAREALARKGMDDSQVTGSASSYARKYALNGLFCIDDNKDADAEQAEKNASSSSQTQKKPTSVDDYYQLVIDWARANEAVMFIGPLLKAKFNKGHFKELSLAEAKAFYENIDKLVDAVKAKDDAALMEGV